MNTSNRRVHGGEVLGATPGHPLLVSALSAAPGLSMSRQQALLDLQAIQRIPGLAGYWPADPAYLYEDSAGTIPASVGGVVGRSNNLSPISTIGAPVSINGTFSDLSGWVAFPGVNTIEVVGGRLHLVSDGSGCYLSTGASLSPYTTYRVSFDYEAVSGGIKVTVGNGQEIYHPAGSGTMVADTITGASAGTLVIARASACNVYIDNLTVTAITTNAALQATTANKPYLRRTPTSNVHWLDSNTRTSALTATLGNLGAACTVARATAEGVTFTEGVTISSTYNIAPAYGFNGDVAIFDRALTVTEKALLTRYMTRGVPLLGANVVENSAFDTDTWWSKASAAITIIDGVARVTSAPNTYTISRANVLTVGTSYVVTFSVKNYSSGICYQSSTSSAKSLSGNGTMTVIITPTAGLLGMSCGSSPSTFDIDDVTVRPIL